MPSRNGQTEAGRKREVLRPEPDSVTVPHSTVFPQAKKESAESGQGWGAPPTGGGISAAPQPSTPAGAQQAKEPTLTVTPEVPPLTPLTAPRHPAVKAAPCSPSDRQLLCHIGHSLHVTSIQPLRAVSPGSRDALARAGRMAMAGRRLHATLSSGNAT